MPLPIPGASKNSWGSQLNEFLRTAHNEDGSLKDVATETDFLALSSTVDQVGSQVSVSINPDGSLKEDQVESAVSAYGGPTGPEWSEEQAATAPLRTPGNNGQVLTVVDGDPLWADLIVPAANTDIAAVGDSITHYSILDGYPRKGGHLYWAMWLSQGRIHISQVEATIGQTITWIRDNEVPAILAATPRPKWCSVMAGTNDVTTGRTLAQITADMVALLDTLIAGGVTPILGSLLPRDDSGGAFKTLTIEANRVFQQLANERGIPFVDYYAVCVDQTGATNDWEYPTANGNDGYHPGPDAAKAMGQAFADVMVPLIPSPYAALVASNVDPINLQTNGLMLIDSNADGTPNGWANAWGDHPGELNSSLVPMTADEGKGNWYELEKDVGSGTQLMVRSSDIPVTPGDVIEISAKAKIAIGSGGQVVAFEAVVDDYVTVVSRLIFDQNIGHDVAVYSGRGVVPPGATVLRVAIHLLGIVTLSLGQVTVRNLTALGLA